MIKKLSIYGAFAILSLVMVVSALLSFKSKPGVAQELFKLLEPGMTRAELRRRGGAEIGRRR